MNVVVSFMYYPEIEDRLRNFDCRRSICLFCGNLLMCRHDAGIIGSMCTTEWNQKKPDGKPES